MNATAANVLSCYLRADSDMLTAGLSWYDRAHDFARTLDASRFHRAAGVIAALSPLNGWNNNKAKAELLYRNNGEVNWNGKSNGYGLSVNVRKAVAIYRGEDAFDILKGDKVRAFFATIVDPRDANATPVIDRHAFDIAIGEVTNDKARGILSRKGEYERFADCYREAASIAGIGAPQMQAVTWMQWRKEKGITD